MKKSRKTIIYMLVALFVAVSVAFVDVCKCYAAGDGFSAGSWRWYQIKSDHSYKEIEVPAVISDSYDSFSAMAYPDMSGFGSDYKHKKYKLKVDYVFLSSDNVYKGYRIVYESNSPIACVIDNAVDLRNEGFYAGSVKEWVDEISFVSLSKLYREDHELTYIENGWVDVRTTCYNGIPSDYKVDNIPYSLSYEILNNVTYKGISLSGDYLFFSDAAGVKKYIVDGDSSGVSSWDRTPKQTYNKDVHFDSFNMDVHASNSLDNYYIDFRYSLPNNLVGEGYSLRIDSIYRREVTNSITGESMFSKDYTDYQYVTLSDNPFSCRIYLKDFNSVRASFKDKYSDLFSKYMDVTSKNYDAVYLGVTSHIDQIGYKVSMSLLNVTCKLYRSGNCGYAYSGSLDLLTGANDISSYTPDSNGTYKPNNDYRQNGYYYTEVSTDAAENTTYNYYYITNDNSRTEITKDENDNNSKSGEGIGNNSSSSASTSGNITNNNSPTFNNNNNITIEGDSINNEVNNIVDSSSSAEDNKNFIEKFLGFFQLLENNSFLGVWGKVFGWLPPGISSVITTALGIGACVGLFRFFRR